MQAPGIDPYPGAYAEGASIRILCSEPSAEIFYTLDGSTPLASSKGYRGPIVLGADTTADGKMRLRAIAVGRDGDRSPVAAADFQLAPGISIRFRKPRSWSSAYVHYWDTTPDRLATDWPGQPMAVGGDGWYRTHLPGQTAANLVLSDAGGQQTRDLRIDTADAWIVDGECWRTNPEGVRRFLFPGGAAKALVISMDDGSIQDRRLVEILNRHGIPGTFHLNSGRLGQPGYLDAGEIASLFAGHEVSTHSVSHPYLDALSRAEIKAEVAEDQAALERDSGQTVRGHAYPFGAHNAAVVEVLRELEIIYARTAYPTGACGLPSDLLRWHPTCHHKGAAELVDAFLALPSDGLSLFFVFGHSWELDAGEPNSSWPYMESLAQRLGNRDDIWYATAIEVADYVRAICSVRPSLANDRLLNPSGIDLWLRNGRRLPAQ